MRRLLTQWVLFSASQFCQQCDKASMGLEAFTAIHHEHVNFVREKSLSLKPQQ
jgi:hypothetical protein